MAARDKWITGLAPRGPVSAAAHEALACRLPLVSERLPAAAARYQEDVEHIHQLRVAVRRTAAALDVFEPCLPSKRARRLGRLLRKIRRAAGAARDWDVFAEHIACDSPVLGDDEKSAVLASAARRRVAAQRAVVEAFELAASQRLGRQAEKLCERIHWRGDGDEPRLADYAGERLAALLQAATAAAQSDLKVFENLHALRIAGKRLRYAMELLASAFPRKLRERAYGCVEALQDRLGRINDHATFVKLIAEERRRYDSEPPPIWLRLGTWEAQESSRLQMDFLDSWHDADARKLDRLVREMLENPLRKTEVCD